jgi:hypothetical protein
MRPVSILFLMFLMLVFVPATQAASGTSFAHKPMIGQQVATVSPNDPGPWPVAALVGMIVFLILLIDYFDWESWLVHTIWNAIKNVANKMRWSLSWMVTLVFFYGLYLMATMPSDPQTPMGVICLGSLFLAIAFDFFTSGWEMTGWVMENIRLWVKYLFTGK